MTEQNNSTDQPETGNDEPKANVVRRLYDWVISWAESPYGTWALFFIALVESSVFPIPPDVLLLALALGAPRRSFFLAGVCALGSILGAVIGYLIGLFFFDTVGMWVVETYHLQEKLPIVQAKYQEGAFVALLAAGFTPIPFKVFTILSGMMKIPLSTLVIASAISRTARFMIVAAVVFFFGDWARTFIDKYFGLLTTAFMVLLIGGLVLVKHFM